MIRLFTLVCATLSLAVISFSAYCENYGFLSNSAMSYFTKEDWQIFNKTQQSVLDHGKAGVKTQWKNPQSGSYGYMIPSNIMRENGMICRKLTFFNNANRISGEGSYKFCKTNGKWKIY
jgi:surface antigen